MPAKTAAIIGATGLIGSELLKLLQNDDAFSSVRVLTRRLLDIQHPKTEMKMVNFDDQEMFKMAIDGCDIVFCAVGTTVKKVKGDLEAYRRVDVDIPIQAAAFCAETGCRHFLVVSSIGADIGKKNFYLKMKGEMEMAVLQKNIAAISIFRPSQLLGERHESRPREELVQKISKAVSFIIPKHYKPISGKQVAKTMVEVAKTIEEGKRVFENEEILDYPSTVDQRPEQQSPA